MSDLICTVDQGRLRGCYDKDIDGAPFINFLGIPYARAPVGKLRFKPPQAPDKWKDVRDATKDPPPCCSVQIVFGMAIPSLKMMGSEDCLFLNVYTRQVFKEGQDLKPVMMYIHGGAFITGSCSRNYYGPNHLMIEDVVLVTINYRLGALGFLVFDDASLGATGNVGFKDQVLALKWIQNNIKSFGGDPSNVTIFGQSAGSVSVHNLILSPSAQGLFHKAIMQSGAALCPWARGVNDAKRLARELGCKEADAVKIFNFLQDIPVEKLVKAQKKLISEMMSDNTQKLYFGPAIEPKSKSHFSSTDPIDLLISGSYNHVPLMMGYTSLEGIIAARGCYRLQKKSKNMVPYDFSCLEGSEEYKKVNRKMLRFYFGNRKLVCFNKLGFATAFTDIVFLRGIYLSAKAHLKTAQNPLYFYRMSVRTKLNYCSKLFRFKQGVCHADDCFYLFRTSVLKVKKDSVEDTVVRRFVRLWANFARTGNPTPKKDPLLGVEWKAATEDKLHYLDIGQELKAGVDPDNARMRFWDEISQAVQNKKYKELLDFIRTKRK